MTSVRAFLDTCVLVPIDTTAILLNAAEAGLFTPLWSPQVMQELERVVPLVQPAVSTTAIRRRIGQMNRAFEDANVMQSVVLSTSFDLPDEGDRHVLAAAIAGRADVLVTDNLRDFPEGVLRAYTIEKRSLDDFLLDLLDLNPVAVLRALRYIADAARHPQRDVPAVLASLARCNAENFVRAVQTQLWRLLGS